MSLSRFAVKDTLDDETSNSTGRWKTLSNKTFFPEMPPSYNSIPKLSNLNFALEKAKIKSQYRMKTETNIPAQTNFSKDAYLLTRNNLSYFNNY